MRFILKTSYDQDIKLVRHSGYLVWYGLLLLALVAAPWLLPKYLLAQLTFVLIYSIVGLGLMLLTGYTGQFSIGQAAFMGVGAYTEAVLSAKGWPFPFSMALAVAISAAVGIVVGLPALRLKGMYIAVATLAFGFIVEEGLVRWESVTGGSSGKSVGKAAAFGWVLDSDERIYAVCLICTIACTLVVLNLLRSPTGRAFVAIRDSEISAQSMGINLARYKSLAFAMSAALAGLGGALYAHKLQFLAPEQFSLIQSVDLMLMVIIGGLGSMHGAFFGAIYLIGMPELISLFKGYLPESIADAGGLQGAIYGVVLIAFVMFEPTGVYGRWFKVRTWLELQPLYRRGMFKRQKAFQKSERLK